MPEYGYDRFKPTVSSRISLKKNTPLNRKINANIKALKGKGFYSSRTFIQWRSASFNIFGVGLGNRAVSVLLSTARNIATQPDSWLSQDG